MSSVHFLSQRSSFRTISASVVSAFMLFSLLSFSQAQGHADPTNQNSSHSDTPQLSTATWARAGARYYIHHKGDYYICTVGFPATDADKRHYFITAGHCGDPGDVILQETSSVQGFNNQPSLIAQLIKAITGISARVKLTPVGRIIAKAGQTASGATLDIGLVELNKTSRLGGGYAQVPINISSPAPGMKICKVGSVTGRTCGTVLNLNKTISPDNYKARLIADKARMCVISGDSGGAVISHGAAVGIVTAGENVKFCNPWRIPISYITNLSMGVKVLQSKFPTLKLA